MNQITHWINGALDTSKPERSGDVYNPATGKVSKTVAFGNAATVDSAVTAATNAFVEWRHSSLTKRSQVLFAFRELVLQNKEKIAALITDEHGKVLSDAAGEVTRGLEVVEFACGIPHLLKGGYSEEVSTGVDVYSIRQALGPVAIISPFNFPAMVPMWFFPVAIACGNTVIVKPSEKDPSAIMFIAELLKEAGLPDGVVNIVTGDGVTGAALVNHPDINKIAFTGSTEVGKSIARAISGSKKTATLELGGKAANIVFDDAAIDEAVEGIVNGIFFNQGHVCCAGSRLILQENVAEEVLDKLKKRMSLIRVGDPMDKNTDLGAINSKEQLNKINEISNAGDKEGANRWSPELKLPSKGFWFPPTIFTGVTQSHRIAREEIFGPVLSVLTFRTPAEAIEKANNTMYGLSAGIWSDKGSKVLWAAKQLKAGVIWSNTFNKFDPASPFGGYKESGWGREGGRHGLSGYLTAEAKVNK